MFCREAVAQLRDHLPEIEKRGARVAVIGNGSPQQAAAFQKEHGAGFEVFVDPSLAAYSAAGLVRKLAATVTWRSALHGLRALKAGHRQGRIQGDALQQGGVLVIGGGGELLYRHADATGGDNAPVDEVLAALDNGANH